MCTDALSRRGFFNSLSSPRWRAFLDGLAVLCPPAGCRRIVKERKALLCKLSKAGITNAGFGTKTAGMRCRPLFRQAAGRIHAHPWRICHPARFCSRGKGEAVNQTQAGFQAVGKNQATGTFVRRNSRSQPLSRKHRFRGAQIEPTCGPRPCAGIRGEGRSPQIRRWADNRRLKSLL